MDHDEYSMRPGTIALQLWCLGPQGPDGGKMRSHFDALDAGVVAAQAALSFAPELSFVEELASRIGAVEMTETNRRLEHDTPDGTVIDAATAMISNTSEWCLRKIHIRLVAFDLNYKPRQGKWIHQVL